MSSTDHSAMMAPPVRVLDRQDRRRRLAAIGIGNFMEWFDFAIYGYFAAAIGAQFFPTGDPTTELLIALAVFAVGFFSRPVGALILGPIGDRYGRRPLLVITVLGMGLATALIGLTPSYSSWGIAASIIVITLRFVQGAMVGGEWPAAAAYLGESAPAGKRGLYASIMTVTAGLAFLVGTGIATLISMTLTPEQGAEWGWRLPFIASVILAGIALYIRRNLDDTPVFEEIERRRTENVLEKIDRKEFLRGFTLALAFSAVFGLTLYYFITYTPNYLAGVVGMPRSFALTVVSIGLVATVIANPLVGALSDRIGRRPIALTGAIAVVVFSVPMFMAMSSGQFGWAALAAVVVGVLLALCGTMNAVLLVEVFPASRRSTGAALGHNIANAVVSGPGPFVAAWLVAATGNLVAPGFYLGAVALLCFAVLALWLPETYKRNISEG